MITPPTEAQIAAAHWVVTHPQANMPTMVRQWAWSTIHAARNTPPQPLRLPAGETSA